VFSFRKFGFLMSVNPSSLHPSKVLKVHAIPTSFQVSPFPCSTALAGSGEPTGRRLGGIACVEPFAYVLGVAALGNLRARELLLAVVADLAYPKTFAIGGNLTFVQCVAGKHA
jgi:hypothetical protein